jgi:hypothetical protein
MSLFNFFLKMQEKKGCPKCQWDKTTIHYAGALTEATAFITGGRTIVATIPDTKYFNESYKKRTIDQCHTCKALWDTRYDYPDRPPGMISSTYIPIKDYKSTFASLATDLTEAYPEGHVSK